LEEDYTSFVNEQQSTVSTVAQYTDSTPDMLQLNGDGERLDK
jgi:hypothetical protein